MRPWKHLQTVSGRSHSGWDSDAPNLRLRRRLPAASHLSVAPNPPGVGAEAAQIKERANARRRDKISNKIAGDFSFGPLVKTPSCADRTTVGTGLVFQALDTETLKFGGQTGRMQKCSQRKLKLKREGQRMNSLEVSASFDINERLRMVARGGGHTVVEAGDKWKFTRFFVNNLMPNLDFSLVLLCRAPNLLEVHLA